MKPANKPIQPDIAAIPMDLGNSHRTAKISQCIGMPENYRGYMGYLLQVPILTGPRLGSTGAKVEVRIRCNKYNMARN
jgi:hypothetical protein